MAYMNQEKKAKIAAALKQVMPKDWKWSLAVHHHSEIILTIREAPVDLLAIMNARGIEADRRRGTSYFTPSTTYADVNRYHLDQHFEGELLELFRRIKAALDTDNHDHSDMQSDYFDVGHHVAISIGRWDKPFICTAAKAAA